MGTLLGLLMIVGLIVIIVGAILFFIDYAKKNSKKVSLIVLSSGLALVLVGGVGAIAVQNHQDKIIAQEKAAQARLIKRKNTKFITTVSSFLTTLNVAWGDTEKLDNKTNKGWYNAIESDSESFDVNKTIENIQSNNADLIASITTEQDQLNSDIKKLKDNDTGKYDLKKYETANEKMKAYSDFVTAPSGSYSDYGSKTTDLDNAVNTAVDAITD